MTWLSPLPVRAARTFKALSTSLSTVSDVLVFVINAFYRQDDMCGVTISGWNFVAQ